jgi:hypothetical protein
MASDGGNVRFVMVGAGEVLALQLAERAAAAALEVLQAGGYQPTPEQLQQIAHALTTEALAAGLTIPGNLPEITDEQLDRAADLSGHAAVVEVLGPPARAAVQ